MSRQVIAEYCYLVKLICPTQTNQVINISIRVHREIKYLVMFNSSLLRYRKYQSLNRLIYFSLWNSQRIQFRTVFNLPNCLCIEQSLIQIDYAIMLTFKLSYLFFNIQSPLFILFVFVRIYRLSEFYAFLPYFMGKVKFSEKRAINSMIAKLAMKQDASLL